VLLGLWIIGIALLGNKIGPMVLSRSCGMSTWLTTTGLMVCRIYKALFAFIVLAASSVLAAAALDLKVWLGAGGSKRNPNPYREIGGEKQRSAGGLASRFGLKERAKTWRERGGYEGDMATSSTATGAPGLHAQGVTGRGIASLKEPQPSPGFSDAGDMGDSQRLVAESPEMVSVFPRYFVPPCAEADLETRAIHHMQRLS
jgi:hypothetical protein